MQMRQSCGNFLPGIMIGKGLSMIYAYCYRSISFHFFFNYLREKFFVLQKNCTFASRILSKCTKSLIFSTLLRQVSVATTHARVGFLFFRVINLLIF